jgi:hypothetical protein
LKCLQTNIGLQLECEFDYSYKVMKQH